MVDKQDFQNLTRHVSGNFSHSPTCVSQPADEATIWGIVFAYLILFLAAMTGNSFIIQIIRTSKSLRHIPFNHVILNLAVSDTIYALFVVPLAITYLFVRSKWFPGGFGVFMCKVSQFCTFASLLSTILTLCTISGERYWGILYAMKQPLSMKAVRWLIGVIWLASAALASPQLYGFTTIQVGDGNSYCVPQWSTNMEKNIEISKTIHVLTFVICYAAPLSTIAVLYGRMIFYLWSRIPPGEDNATNKKKARTQGQQVVTMLVAVVIAFALCWFPAHVCHYLISFKFEVYMCLPLAVTHILFWFAHANSAINPWLCIMFNSKFRSVWLRRVTHILKRGQTRSQSATVEMKHLFTMNTPLSQRKGFNDSFSTPKSWRRYFNSSPCSSPLSCRRSLFKQETPPSSPPALQPGVHNASAFNHPKSPDSPLVLRFSGFLNGRHGHELLPPSSPL